MINAPFQGFPPELLAKIAQGAFRPPGATGGMPGGMQMPQSPGFNMGQGMGGLGMGLGAFQPSQRGDGNTTPEGNISGFAVGGGPQGPSGGSLAPQVPGMMLNPSDASYGDLGGPGGTFGQPAGGGGFGAWWQRNVGRSLF